MIKSSRAVTMAEVTKLVKDLDRGADVTKFVKGFNVLSFEKAMKLSDELKALDMIKLKEESIVKIVDFVPTDASELNKVIIEVSLDADEVNRILNITQKFK